MSLELIDRFLPNFELVAKLIFVLLKAILGAIPVLSSLAAESLKFWVSLPPENATLLVIVCPVL